MTTDLSSFGWQRPKCAYGVMGALTRVSIFGTLGVADGQFDRPYDIAYSPDGSRMAVIDSNNNRLQVFGANGTTLTHQVSYGSSGSADGQFATPYNIAFNNDGTRIAVSDTGRHRIQIFGIAGNTVTHQISFGSYGAANGRFSAPCGVSFSPDGSRIVVADRSNHRIQILGITGNTIIHQASYGTLGAADGQFNRPTGVSFSPAGASLSIAIADGYNNRIQIVDVSGNTITHITSYGTLGTAIGQFTNPNGIAYDPSGTRIGIADTGNSRLQLLAVSGATITPLIGYGVSGSAAAAGYFKNPTGISFNPNGVYIASADVGNNRIQIM